MNRPNKEYQEKTFNQKAKKHIVNSNKPRITTTQNLPQNKLLFSYYPTKLNSTSNSNNINTITSPNNSNNFNNPPKEKIKKIIISELSTNSPTDTPETTERMKYIISKNETEDIDFIKTLIKLKGINNNNEHQINKNKSYNIHINNKTNKYNSCFNNTNINNNITNDSNNIFNNDLYSQGINYNYINNSNNNAISTNLSSNKLIEDESKSYIKELIDICENKSNLNNNNINAYNNNGYNNYNQLTEINDFNNNYNNYYNYDKGFTHNNNIIGGSTNKCNFKQIVKHQLHPEIFDEQYNFNKYLNNNNYNNYYNNGSFNISNLNIKNEINPLKINQICPISPKIEYNSRSITPIASRHNNNVVPFLKHKQYEDIMRNEQIKKINILNNNINYNLNTPQIDKKNDYFLKKKLSDKIPNFFYDKEYEYSNNNISNNNVNIGSNMDSIFTKSNNNQMNLNELKDDTNNNNYKLSNITPNTPNKKSTNCYFTSNNFYTNIKENKNFGLPEIEDINKLYEEAEEIEKKYGLNIKNNTVNNNKTSISLNKKNNDTSSMNNNANNNISDNLKNISVPKQELCLMTSQENNLISNKRRHLTQKNSEKLNILLNFHNNFDNLINNLNTSQDKNDKEKVIINLTDEIENANNDQEKDNKILNIDDLDDDINKEENNDNIILPLDDIKENKENTNTNINNTPLIPDTNTNNKENTTNPSSNPPISEILKDQISPIKESKSITITSNQPSINNFTLESAQIPNKSQLQSQSKELKNNSLSLLSSVNQNNKSNKFSSKQLKINLNLNQIAETPRELIDSKEKESKDIALQVSVKQFEQLNSNENKNNNFINIEDRKELSDILQDNHLDNEGFMSNTIANEDFQIQDINKEIIHGNNSFNKSSKDASSCNDDNNNNNQKEIDKDEKNNNKNDDKKYESFNEESVVNEVDIQKQNETKEIKLSKLSINNNNNCLVSCNNNTQNNNNCTNSINNINSINFSKLTNFADYNSTNDGVCNSGNFNNNNHTSKISQNKNVINLNNNVLNIINNNTNNDKNYYSLAGDANINSNCNANINRNEKKPLIPLPPKSNKNNNNTNSINNINNINSINSINSINIKSSIQSDIVNFKESIGSIDIIKSESNQVIKNSNEDNKNQDNNIQKEAENNKKGNDQKEEKSKEELQKNSHHSITNSKDSSCLSSSSSPINKSEKNNSKLINSNVNNNPNTNNINTKNSPTPNTNPIINPSPVTNNELPQKNPETNSNKKEEAEDVATAVIDLFADEEDDDENSNSNNKVDQIDKENQPISSYSNSNNTGKISQINNDNNNNNNINIKSTNQKKFTDNFKYLVDSIEPIMEKKIEFDLEDLLTPNYMFQNFNDIIPKSELKRQKSKSFYLDSKNNKIIGLSQNDVDALNDIRKRQMILENKREKNEGLLKDKKIRLNNIPYNNKENKSLQAFSPGKNNTGNNKYQKKNSNNSLSCNNNININENNYNTSNTFKSNSSNNRNNKSNINNNNKKKNDNKKIKNIKNKIPRSPMVNMSNNNNNINNINTREKSLKNANKNLNNNLNHKSNNNNPYNSPLNLNSQKDTSLNKKKFKFEPRKAISSKSTNHAYNTNKNYCHSTINTECSSTKYNNKSNGDKDKVKSIKVNLYTDKIDNYYDQILTSNKQDKEIEVFNHKKKNNSPVKKLSDSFKIKRDEKSKSEISDNFKGLHIQKEEEINDNFRTLDIDKDEFMQSKYSTGFKKEGDQ